MTIPENGGGGGGGAEGLQSFSRGGGVKAIHHSNIVQQVDTIIPIIQSTYVTKKLIDHKIQ